MPTVEVVVRLHYAVMTDVETVQEAVLDSLYAAGFSRIEPVSSTLVEEDSDDYC